MRTPEDKALAAAYRRGVKREKAGDVDGAAAAYEEALRLDPDDHGGVSVRLAAIGRAEPPPRAPMAYVATLFDQHAEEFEDILVAKLGYRTPKDIRAALTGRFSRMLDLGCGTGLAGRALRDVTDHRTGVDLAEEMVSKAFDSRAYDDLYVGDAEGFLEAAAEEGETWDLIVAADVLPYLGAVERLFALCAGRLNVGGTLVFSTEHVEDAGPRGWMVGPKHRFAHAETYLRAALTAAGLTPQSLAPIVVRTDAGAPVHGRLVVARRP